MTNEARSAAAQGVRRKGRALQLYNILFPAWMFYLFPTGLWFLLLPANFAIDSLVLFLAMKRLGVEEPRDVWKRSILRVWGFGFLADFLGAILTLALFLLIDAAHLSWDVYRFPGTTLLAVPGVALSAFLICPSAESRAEHFHRAVRDAHSALRMNPAAAICAYPYQGWASSASTCSRFSNRMHPPA